MDLEFNVLVKFPGNQPHLLLHSFIPSYQPGGGGWKGGREDRGRDEGGERGKEREEEGRKGEGEVEKERRELF